MKNVTQFPGPPISPKAQRLQREYQSEIEQIFQLCPVSTAHQYFLDMASIMYLRLYDLDPEFAATMREYNQDLIATAERR